MNKQLLRWAPVVITLLAWLYIFVFSTPVKPWVKNDTQLHIDSTVINQKIIDSLLIREYELRQQLKEDSVRDSIRNRKYEAKIYSLEQKAKAVNFQQSTSAQLDSVRLAMYPPAADDSAYCMPIQTARLMFDDAATKAIQDSVIAVQGSRIVQLKEEKAEQWNSFNKVLDVKDSTFNLSQDNVRHLNIAMDNIQKENSGLKKQNVGLKILSAAAILVALFK